MPFLSALRKRLQRRISAAILAAFFFSFGGHWYALQGIAWGRMIVTYAQDRGIKSAVLLTLNGQNPCELCHYVDKGRAAQKQSSNAQIENKIKDAFVIPRSAGITPYVSFAVLAQHSNPTSEFLRKSPPVPPPRMAC